MSALLGHMLPPLRFPTPLGEQLREFLQEGEYAQAFSLPMHDITPLSLVDAGLTWCNMGDLHRDRQRVDQALPCWTQAQRLLQQAYVQIQLLKTVTPSDLEPVTSTICVEKLLVEMAQRIAGAEKESIKKTIEAYDNMIMILVNMEDSDKADKWIGTVQIIPMSSSEHVQRMGATLITLGGLYRSQGDNTSALEAWEEALDLLEETPQAPGLLEKLAEIYMEQGDIDRAMDSLMVSLDRKLSGDDKSPASESLKTMDQIGLAQEQWGKLSQALECYEKTLMARSRLLGNQHVDVAQSLLNVGRILEAQGNIAGSLDLYKAAQQIYTNQLTSKGFSVQGADVDTILHQLVPALLEQSRYEEVTAYLYKCLECDEVKLDKSAIYFALGKAHCGMHDYVSATVCLVEATKHEGTVTKDQALSLMKKVQRNGENNDNSVDPFDETDLSSKGSSLSSHDELGLVGNTSLEVLKELLGEDVDPAILHRRSNDSRQTPSPSDQTPENLLTPNRSTTPTEQDKDKSIRICTPVTTDMVHSNHSTDEGGFGDRRQDEHTPQTSPLSKSGTPMSSLPADEVRDDIEQIASSPAASSSADKRSPGKTDLTIRTATITSGSEKMEEHGGVLKVVTTPPPPPPPPLLYSKQNRRFGFSPRRKERSPLKPKKFWKTKGSQSSVRESESNGGSQQLLSPAEGDALDVMALEEEYHTSFDGTFAGPVPYVSVEKSSWDETSQITMNIDFSSNHSRRNTQEWGWGVSTEGFGRWFPTSYVSQAVQAAEGFLSAKAIHAKVRSDPLVVEVEEDCTIDADGNSKDENQDIAPSSPQGEVSSPIQAEHRVDNQVIPITPKQEGPRHASRRKSLAEEIEACQQRLKEQRSTLEGLDPQLSDTLMQLAVLQKSSRQLLESTDSAKQALEIHTACNNTKDAAESNHLLGELYLARDLHKEALCHHTEALRMETKLYGHYSEETAKALNYIGTVQSAQDRFDVAMKCHQEALKILKECHGEDPRDPMIAQTLCLIGSVYYRERNSLATIQEHGSGEGGFSTFIEGGLLETIGRAHEDRGSYKMAISFFEEKLHLLENRVNEFDNPEEELPATLNSLGMLSSRAGLYNEALAYYERGLQLQKEQGPNGPISCATARVLTATVRFHLGHWKESLITLNESLCVLRQEFGDDHGTVAATLYQTGLVHASLCDYNKAMEALHTSLQIQTRLLGNLHPATLRTKREIGNLYAVYEAEAGTALDYFRGVLDAQRRVHGEKHPNIAETLYSLGIALRQKGETSEAMSILQECYYMRLEFLGVDHPLQALTLHEIAKMHLKGNRVKKALQICDVVLGIQQDSLDTSVHIDFARTLTTKAQCLCATGDTSTALQILRDQALPLTSKSVGFDHPATAHVYVQLGGVYLRMCQFDEARRYIKLAQEVYSRTQVDDDFPGIQEAANQMLRVERDEMLCV